MYIRNGNKSDRRIRSRWYYEQSDDEIDQVASFHQQKQHQQYQQQRKTEPQWHNFGRSIREEEGEESLGEWSFRDLKLDHGGHGGYGSSSCGNTSDGSSSYCSSYSSSGTTDGNNSSVGGSHRRRISSHTSNWSRKSHSNAPRRLKKRNLHNKSNNNNYNNYPKSDEENNVDENESRDQEWINYRSGRLWSGCNDNDPSSPNSTEEGVSLQEQLDYILFSDCEANIINNRTNDNYNIHTDVKDNKNSENIIKKDCSTSSLMYRSDEDNYEYSQKNSSSSWTSVTRIPLVLMGFLLVGALAIATSEISASHAFMLVQELEENERDVGLRIREYQRDIRSLEEEMESVLESFTNAGQGLSSQKNSNNDEGSRHLVSSVENNHDHHNSRGLMMTSRTSLKTTMGSNDSLLRKQEGAMMEMKALQARLRKEAQQAIELKREVQRVSYADVLQKYGPGPHRIEMQLIFPSDVAAGSTNGSGGGGGLKNNHLTSSTTFVIELAPVQLMPHSVHTFLEMASNKLLDGCSFILNALHVVKAAPLPYDGSTAAMKAKAFSELGLESGVVFKEYSDLYPHKKYTIGFAADGSPSFYINTADNRDIHVGDPCFGTVISGWDVIQRLENSPTRNGIWFEKRIGIRSATILLSDTIRNS